MDLSNFNKTQQIETKIYNNILLISLNIAPSSAPSIVKINWIASGFQVCYIRNNHGLVMFPEEKQDQGHGTNVKGLLELSHQFLDNLWIDLGQVSCLQRILY